jgi:hypothetical protein
MQLLYELLDVVGHGHHSPGRLLFLGAFVNLQIVLLHLGFQLLLNHSNIIDSGEEHIKILHGLVPE